MKHAVSLSVIVLFALLAHWHREPIRVRLRDRPAAVNAG